MRDAKPCKRCQASIVRDARTTDANWARRAFCNAKCRKAHDNAMERNGNFATQSNRRKNTPVTPEEAGQFVALLKAGVSDAEAAKQLGRANPEILTRRSIMFGLLPPRRPQPAEDAAPVPPKPTRYDPLPVGSDETWGVMMPGISWAEAQRQTAHMGRN